MDAKRSVRDTKTPSLHSIAALYQRSVFDPMIEIARAVSHDFMRRPHKYRAVSAKTAQVLEGFRIRTGSNPEWLSPTQRGTIYSSLFGAAFCSTTIGLRGAALDLVEGSPNPNPDVVHAVRDAALTFRGYLRSVDGQVVSVADSETKAIFQSAIDVFRDDAVAAVFGSQAARGRDWPLSGDGYTDGAYLLETIQRAFGLYEVPLMEHNRFLLLEQVARYGARTITAVITEQFEVEAGDEIHELASYAYGWEKALQRMLRQVNVIRAWKDPRYRETLTASEKAMLPPHPSGEVDLKDTQLDSSSARRLAEELGFSTETAFEEVCCCTGDLPCPLSTYKCTGSTCRTSCIECTV
jgi:mersacidin/lichenicidin family type 2 lantibiotic